MIRFLVTFVFVSFDSDAAHEIQTTKQVEVPVAIHEGVHGIAGKSRNRNQLAGRMSRRSYSYVNMFLRNTT